MEKMQYVVEDYVLARLLGIQSFSNKESAILELVKNAFDANATTLTIIIKKDCIEIKDNGCGMNREDIINKWMHIGKSEKGYEINGANGKKRVLAGSKGIGRFALARLGSDVKIYSHKDKYQPIVWVTNWNYSSLEYEENDSFVGTQFFIMDLRDKWTAKSVRDLAEYLGRTYCDDSMKVRLFFEDKEFTVEYVFKSPEKGVNFSSKIVLAYSAKKRRLTFSLELDEFSDQAKKYCKNNISYYSSELDLNKEYQGNNFFDESAELDRVLFELGDFEAELYFGVDRVLKNDQERFLYKRRMLEKRYNYGIILYRNAFSISSYEGKKDWLGLGRRSRKSPAAATHPTGAWRVRENQISGAVRIDKQRNSHLQDLANRQGLEENNHYKLFIEIIHTGLAEFERYRQSLIRDIGKKNKIEIPAQKSIVEQIIKRPKMISGLSKEEESKFIDELKDLQESEINYKKNGEVTESRYKYDVRILNVLATSGLKATSIAHEMKNDRNIIYGNYEFIVDALKKYDMWEELCDSDHTRFAYLNVPELLMKNRDVGKKLLQFIDIMLENVEQEQFSAEEHYVKELMDKVKTNWESDYGWIKINIVMDEQLKFKLPEDIITVIFDNLILNSIQQNEKRNNLRIDIRVELMTNTLRVRYADDGDGLPEKYQANPMKILEPHETSRKKGHGLGMWIVNNTLNMSGGEVLNIASQNGFVFDFLIGGNL